MKYNRYNVIRKINDTLIKCIDPIRNVYLDNIQGVINTTYTVQPPVKDKNGNILNNIDPAKVPEAIIRSNTGFELDQTKHDHVQTLGILEIYGNHPKSYIRHTISSIEFNKIVCSEAIDIVRKDIL